MQTFFTLERGQQPLFQSPENFMAISCVEFQRSATAVEVVNSPMDDEEENLQLKTDFFTKEISFWSIANDWK